MGPCDGAHHSGCPAAWLALRGAPDSTVGRRGRPPHGGGEGRTVPAVKGSIRGERLGRRAYRWGPAGGAALLGLAGLLAAPGTIAPLAWLALVAPAAGAWAAAGAPAPALVPPLVWAFAVAAVGQAPGALSGSFAVALLFALGVVLGAGAGPRAWVRGAWLALVALGLSLLPLAGRVLVGAPLDPRWAARALDLAPTSLVLECAGIDWMRHPALYEAADTASIGPDLRTPYSGSLAVPAGVLVGCAALARLLTRRRVPGPHAEE